MNEGDTIGKYRLVSRLGRGGMGEVWLAKASGYMGFSKTVVLKTLLPELAEDPLFVDLLAREAKTCSALGHPNLIEVFDFTKHDGVYLLSMEHVLGEPLSALLRTTHLRKEMLPPWFALRIAWECCGGLQFAHDQGVIHCDLSPSNVMVTYTGTTKILDFGVAHTSALGPKSDRLKGKYSYMAPERIKTRATDRRTDIYALGVMLYLLFTGRLPFTGETDAELLYKITHEKPIAPSAFCAIEPCIESVILRSMHPDPARRFQTIGEVLEALAPSLDGQLGTYGQQHVAAYISSLMSEPTDAEIEIDVDVSSIASASVPAQEASTRGVCLPSTAHLPPVPPPPTRRPLASVSIPPLAKPPSRPAVAAFARATTPHEPKTSVQSLFGDRPSVSGVGVFPRGTRDDVDEAHALDVDAKWTDDARREGAGSVFGEYSQRPSAGAREVVWPWPVSRLKSD